MIRIGDKPIEERSALVDSAPFSLQGSGLTDRKRGPEFSRCHSQGISSASYCHVDDSLSCGSCRTAFTSVNKAGSDLQMVAGLFQPVNEDFIDVTFSSLVTRV